MEKHELLKSRETLLELIENMDKLNAYSIIESIDIEKLREIQTKNRRGIGTIRNTTALESFKIEEIEKKIMDILHCSFAAFTTMPRPKFKLENLVAELEDLKTEKEQFDKKLREIQTKNRRGIGIDTIRNTTTTLESFKIEEIEEIMKEEDGSLEEVKEEFPREDLEKYNDNLNFLQSNINNENCIPTATIILSEGRLKENFNITEGFKLKQKEKNKKNNLIEIMYNNFLKIDDIFYADFCENRKSEKEVIFFNLMKIYEILAQFNKDENKIISEKNIDSYIQDTNTKITTLDNCITNLFSRNVIGYLKTMDRKDSESKLSHINHFYANILMIVFNVNLEIDEFNIKFNRSKISLENESYLFNILSRDGMFLKIMYSAFELGIHDTFIYGNTKYEPDTWIYVDPLDLLEAALRHFEKMVPVK